jgi:xanthine dehydrogenase accessory factor
MRELLAALTDSLDANRPCVLCSVVETRGSTPRKAGAAMLVYADGSQAGTLGGGCVEAEVKRQALAVLVGDGSPHPDLRSFRLDDNYGWDDGLICGGRMDILADPVHVAERGDYFRRYRELVDSGQGCTEAVPTSGPLVRSRYLFDPRGALVAGLGPAPPESLIANLVPLASRPKPYHKEGVAYLPILARITLFIVGAGHVGQAVADLAAGLDFDVWVVDDRDSAASASRFPTATRRIVGDLGPTLVGLATELTGDFYALIVTRGHAHDEEALYRLANTACGYVGLIGSKRKIKLIYEDLLAKGISAETLRRVHAPLGLNIGSQTVPEIAVSIVAELIAVRNLGASIAAARTHIDI